jgi:hypothetical protein
VASLLDAFVKIFADSKDVNKVLKQTIPRQAEESGKEASGKFSKAFSSVKNNIVQGIGQGLGLGLTIIGSQVAQQVGQFVATAIGAASDLNEELTKSDQIFGDNADAIQDWASEAADSFGQSSRAALQASSNFAGMFKSVGVGIDEATAGAQELTELGSDLASFFNTDVESALQALRSGLSGEAESLKKYNVFLTESRVKQFAWTHGIAESGKELTEQQKIMARYGLIMEDTSDAQGDFAKTSDGLANTQRALAAQMENLAAEVGQDLLPIALELATWLKDEGIPLFRDFIKVLGEAGDGVDKLAQIFAMINPGDLKARLLDVRKQMVLMGQDTSELDAKLLAMGVDADEVFGKLAGVFDPVAAAAQRAAAETAAAGKYIIDRDHEIVTSVKEIGDTSREVSLIWRTAANNMIADAQKLADETQAQRDEIVGAVNSLIDDAYEPLLVEYELMAVKAEISATRQALAAGGLTKIEKNELNQQLLQQQQTQERLLAEQAQYGNDAQKLAYLQGVLTSKAVTDGLASQDSNRRTATQAAVATIANELVKLESKAGTYGYRTGNAYIDKLLAALEAGASKVNYKIHRIGSFMKASSPPGPESPLHLIDVWGRKTGEAYVDPLVAAIAAGEDRLTAALGSLGTGFHNPPSAMGMPGAGNWTASGGRAAQGYVSAASGDRSTGAPNRAGSGDITVNVTGLMKARDPLELVFQLQRAQSTGTLTEEPEYR